MRTIVYKQIGDSPMCVKCSTLQEYIEFVEQAAIGDVEQSVFINRKRANGFPDSYRFSHVFCFNGDEDETIFHIHTTKNNP